MERRASNESPELPTIVQSDVHDADQRLAPAQMAQRVLTFNEQLERACEVAVAVLVGSLLSVDPASPDRLVRNSRSGLVVLHLLRFQSRIVANRGEATALGEIVIVVIALSAVVHGVTVTPFMRWYGTETSVPQTAQVEA
jgi:NhaP-type Na+/H+ or K+/H+ antiporter